VRFIEYGPGVICLGFKRPTAEHGPAELLGPWLNRGPLSGEGSKVTGCCQKRLYNNREGKLAVCLRENGEGRKERED